MVAHRHLSTVAIATIASTAVLTLSTASAAADPNDDAFLAQMRSIGIGTGDQSLVGYAEAVCNILATPGVSPAQLTDSFEAGSGLTSQNPALTSHNVGLFITASQKYYCPQFLQ